MFLGRQSDTVMDADSRSGSVNGARSDQNNYTLDGLDDNNQNKGYAFEGVIRSTRDSVEEFRVVPQIPTRLRAILGAPGSTWSRAAERICFTAAPMNIIVHQTSWLTNGFNKTCRT